jgi:hypothetical protein
MSSESLRFTFGGGTPLAYGYGYPPFLLLFAPRFSPSITPLPFPLPFEFTLVVDAAGPFALQFPSLPAELTLVAYVLTERIDWFEYRVNVEEDVFVLAIEERHEFELDAGPVERTGERDHVLVALDSLSCELTVSEEREPKAEPVAEPSGPPNALKAELEADSRSCLPLGRYFSSSRCCC